MAMVIYSHTVSTKQCTIGVTKDNLLFEALGQREAVASSLCITAGQNINVFAVLDNVSPSRDNPWGICVYVW